MAKARIKMNRTPEEKRRRAVNAAAFLLVLAGVLALVYPTISDWYYRVDHKEQVQEFETQANQLDPAVIRERMHLAVLYNQTLNNTVKGDPYSEKNREKGIKHYAHMLEVREKIGVVQVPTADIMLPIFAGTGEDVLQQAAGHLEGTSLPIGGNSTHAVITAHSGLPEKKLFTDLHEVKEGDRFYLTNIKETLAYQVDQITTIEPTDLAALKIVPGHDYVTLLTCTPIGINTHRLLVRGHRIPYQAAVEEKVIAENASRFLYQKLFYFSCAVIVVLLAVIVWQRRSRKKGVEHAE